MSYIATFDIETVPQEAALQEPYPEAERHPPANYKKDESIAKWREEDKVSWSEARVKACSTSPMLGRILAIVIRQREMDSDQGTLHTLLAKEENEERHIVNEACHILADAKVVVTWNGQHFDGPFMTIRQAKYRASAIATLDIRPWDMQRKVQLMQSLTPTYRGGRHVDVKQALVGSRFNAQFTESLEGWSKSFGFPVPQTGLTGEDIYPMYRAGKFDAILQKCSDDTVMTERLFDAVMGWL